MPDFSFVKLLTFTLKKLFQLFIVVVGGAVLIFGLNAAMSPSQPQTGGNWVWIDAPKIPFLWHRGWWLECHRNSDIYCTLESGSDHSVVYSGAYVPCDAAPANGSYLGVVASLTPGMWVVTPNGDQLAPVVRLQGNTLLVPAGTSAQCDQIKKRLK